MSDYIEIGVGEVNVGRSHDDAAREADAAEVKV